MADYFFYGTLLDDDVVRAVLGRSLESLKPIAARLDGYSRRCVEGATYPAAIPMEDDFIDGIIARDLTEREEAILAAYEGEEYGLTRVQVTDRNQNIIDANVFVPGESIRPSNKHWDFDDWVRDHKETFLAETLPVMTSRN